MLSQPLLVVDTVFNMAPSMTQLASLRFNLFGAVWLIMRIMKYIPPSQISKMHLVLEETYSTQCRDMFSKLVIARGYRVTWGSYGMIGVPACQPTTPHVQWAGSTTVLFSFSTWCNVWIRRSCFVSGVDWLLDQ